MIDFSKIELNQALISAHNEIISLRARLAVAEPKAEAYTTIARLAALTVHEERSGYGVDVAWRIKGLLERAKADGEETPVDAEQVPAGQIQGSSVPPQAGSGCQPAASAAEEASSRSGIPNAADLAEHWFTLRLRTWRDVKRAVLATGEPAHAIADFIDMPRRRLSGILNGTVANVTMRELHNMARVSGYRLRVVVEKLPASAIEARRAATENAGAVHESATRQGDAQPGDPQ